MLQDQGSSLQVPEAYVNLSDSFLSDDRSAVMQSCPSGNTPLSSRHQIVSEYMSLNPATKFKNWEVSREHVQISKVIGKGAFSQVAKATVLDINGIKGNKTVAVKMLKGKRAIHIHVHSDFKIAWVFSNGVHAWWLRYLYY